jgi:plastocyanin
MSDQTPPAGPPPATHDPAEARASQEPQARRELPPLMYPLLGLVFGGILVWSFSRVLLASPKDAAPAIALAVAVNVLLGAALVAYGSRVRRRPTAFPLLVGAGLAVVAAGIVALSLGEQPLESHAEVAGKGGVEVSIAAKGIKFDKDELTFAAGAQVTLAFDNMDAGTPHNVVITKDPAGADALFTGKVITGPAKTQYTFTAPPPGTYYFHCEIHPTTMKGKVAVTSGGAPGGGGTSGGLAITAQNTAFQPTSLTASGGGQITIHFDNKDANIPHNVVVTKDAAADILFSGDIITGPAAKDYTFAAPPPGDYFFHCAIHPLQMKGVLKIT